MDNSPKPFRLYVLTCLPTGKIYVGRSKNPKQRFYAHKNSPRPRMREDVDKYKANFNENFKMEVLPEMYYNKQLAQEAEEQLIYRLDAANAQRGYNTLDGESCRDPRFWAMQAAQKKNTK
jgi:predicted GIY-YIG superfamily endonuclease